jgi:hypothetical protein
VRVPWKIKTALNRLPGELINKIYAPHLEYVPIENEIKIKGFYTNTINKLVGSNKAYSILHDTDPNYKNDQIKRFYASQIYRNIVDNIEERRGLLNPCRLNILDAQEYLDKPANGVYTIMYRKGDVKGTLYEPDDKNIRDIITQSIHTYNTWHFLYDDDMHPQKDSHFIYNRNQDILFVKDGLLTLLKTESAPYIRALAQLLSRYTTHIQKKKEYEYSKIIATLDAEYNNLITAPEYTNLTAARKKRIIIPQITYALEENYNNEVRILNDYSKKITLITDYRNGKLSPEDFARVFTP